jgi:hypothetical protein
MPFDTKAPEPMAFARCVRGILGLLAALIVATPAPLHAAEAPRAATDPAYVDPDFAPRVIGGGGGAVGGNGRLAVIPYEMPKLPPDGAVPRRRIGAGPDISGIYAHALRAWMNPPPSSGVGPGVFGVPTPLTVFPAENNDIVANYGDYRSPLLRPWAAALVKAQGEADAAGMPFFETCAPAGLLITWARPNTLQIIQSPKTVVLLFKGYASRIIHLDGHHPAKTEPSVYGHSVGHWEGDTLVVDTVGFDGRAPLDRFGTPGTRDTHIVERVDLRHGGEVLEVDFWVDDPLVFTQPWKSIVTYARASKVDPEDICQEALMFNHPF